jgi:hypothetical protein
MDQPTTRESQAGPCGVAERPVVPQKPGNAGGGKGPQLKANAESDKGPGILAMSLTTPTSVQKLQTALHAKGDDSVRLLREPDAGNPPVRFDERDVETEHGSASEAPADERAGNR